MFLDGVEFREAVETLIGERSVPVISKPSIAVAKNADDYERDQHKKARWLWSQRLPIVGSIAETYLRQMRGITVPLPPTLAFLPARKPDHHPAMIAAFGLCDEIEPGIIAAPHKVDAIHLTLLKPDGSGKAEVDKAKRMIGSPGGSPIMLTPMNDLLGLAITEGIEDALSVYQATGLGAWAAGSAPHMPGLVSAIQNLAAREYDASPECVSIFTDADAAGTSNAMLLAERLTARGTYAEMVPLAEMLA